MEKHPIIIAGFGRSGTTWLSDIISKSLGGLILFEPFHPGVYEDSRSICYNGLLKNPASVQKHLNDCSTLLPENLWLLRNHLNTPLESNSPSFVNYVWSNSKVIGFKTIRAVHILSSLEKMLDAKTIYIYRHPLAVLSSINNRGMFWEEFGWKWHTEHFFQRTLSLDLLEAKEINHLQQIRNNNLGNDETIIIMWAISFILGFRETQKANGFKLSYESLYLDPYNQITELLRFLSAGDIRLHPSYFFTPSMTTLETLHSLKDNVNDRGDLDRIFWSSKIDGDSAKSYFQLLKDLLAIDNKASALAKKEQYIV